MEIKIQYACFLCNGNLSNLRGRLVGVISWNLEEFEIKIPPITMFGLKESEKSKWQSKLKFLKMEKLECLQKVRNFNLLKKKL